MTGGLRNGWDAYDHYAYAAVAVFGTLVAIALLYWIIAASPFVDWARDLGGVTAPFLNVVGVLFGLTLAFLLGGTIVVEYLFQYPGIGMALNDAVMQRDMPVVQFVVVIMASGYILFNLLADVLTVLVTPKLRTAQ